MLILSCRPSALSQSEQHLLRSWRERKGVEAEVAEVVDEFDGAVRAVDLAGLDAVDGFEELVVVGVVGERQRVVDVPAVLGARVDGPAGGRRSRRCGRGRRGGSRSCRGGG